MISPRDIATLAASLVLAVLIASTPAHAAQAGLTQLGSPDFPERAYVLTLPAGVTPDPADIAVTEDGEPVASLHAEPYGDRSGFGVVLVIDTSTSMGGAPLRDAMSAARAFAAQRPAAQPVGVVTFNRATSTLLKPTTDAGAIDAALASTPKLAPGTNLYDAASAGLDLLTSSGSSAGAVVVLSDGADSGSVATSGAVATAAAKSNARIFTVGVKSRSYNGETLQKLALATQGEYLGATTGNSLRSVYRALGGQLANAYLVRYTSREAAGTRVSVVASAAGISARTRYHAPSLVVSGRSGRDGKPFLATTIGIALVAVSIILAVFLLVANLLAYGARRPTVRERVDAYGESAPIGEAATPGPGERASRIGSARLEALGESLELAGLDVTPTRFIGTVAAGGMLLSWCLVAITGTWLLAPAGLALAAVGGRLVLTSRIAKQRAEFADELADSLQAVASAMRAGHSFAGALSVMSEDAGERTGIEFGRVIADERLGVPLEDALRETIRRMDNSDLEQVALVAVLQRETGGNGAEALDRVVENLRGREEVRRLVRSLTAQGQLSRWILTAMPVVLLLVISVISPGYAEPLWDTTLGNVLVAMGAAFIVAGSLAINKIVKIDV